MTNTSLSSPSTSGLSAPEALPAWIVPATPEPVFTSVGITSSGELYIYGPTPDQPGPIVPALLGVVVDLSVSQHGAQSRYGLRDYLDLWLFTPRADTQLILRLPCKATAHPLTGELLTPWSVRSLLGALLCPALDLPHTAIKLQTRRGESATFFRVIPYSDDGQELQPIRSEAIGGSRADLEGAVNHLRALLDLPPFFPIEPLLA